MCPKVQKLISIKFNLVTLPWTMLKLRDAKNVQKYLFRNPFDSRTRQPQTTQEKRNKNCSANLFAFTWIHLNWIFGHQDHSRSRRSFKFIQVNLSHWRPSNVSQGLGVTQVHSRLPQGHTKVFLKSPDYQKRASNKFRIRSNVTSI